jgi:hypothetical protein
VVSVGPIRWLLTADKAVSLPHAFWDPYYDYLPDTYLSITFI